MCVIVSRLGVRKAQIISLLPKASTFFKQQRIVHRHNWAQAKQRAKRLGCFPWTCIIITGYYWYDAWSFCYNSIYSNCHSCWPLSRGTCAHRALLTAVIQNFSWSVQRDKGSMSVNWLYTSSQIGIYPIITQILDGSWGLHRFTTLKSLASC
jgi:CDP-diglyceride synthetase